MMILPIFFFSFSIYLFLIKRKRKINQKIKYNPTLNTPITHTRLYLSLTLHFRQKPPSCRKQPSSSETTIVTATIFDRNHRTHCCSHHLNRKPLNPTPSFVISNLIVSFVDSQISVRQLRRLLDLYYQKRSLLDSTVT